MPFIFGSGEPVSRLRRALDVKGKVNLQVDETIVPVLQIFDATAPPFRRTGIRWFLDATVGPIAGQFGRVRMFHTLPIDQLIDYISVSSVSGAGYIDFQIGAGPPGIAGGTAVRTTEIMRVDSGGVPSRELPIQFLADTTTPTSLSQLFGHLGFDADNEVPGKWELPIVLPAQSDRGDPITNAPTITVECLKVNQGFHFCASGLYWDSLPLDATT